MKPWKMQKGKLTTINDIPDDGLLYDIGHKTRGSRFKDGHWLIYHYVTQVIYFAKDYVILDAGGYRSGATLKRINHYCEPLGVSVVANGKDWDVWCMDQKGSFKDGIKVDLTGDIDPFDYDGCTDNIGSIKLRDKVLNDARKSLDKTGRMTIEKAKLMASYAGRTNPLTAAESLEHELIFREFSKKCHHTLPKAIQCLKEIDNA